MNLNPSSLPKGSVFLTQKDFIESIGEEKTATSEETVTSEEIASSEEVASSEETVTSEEVATSEETATSEEVSEDIASKDNETVSDDTSARESDFSEPTTTVSTTTYSPTTFSPTTPSPTTLTPTASSTSSPTSLRASSSPSLYPTSSSSVNEENNMEYAHEEVGTEIISTPQSTSNQYVRRPRANASRNPYNDIFKNTRNSHRQAREGEWYFQQYHRIKYYEGSHIDITPRNRTGLPETKEFDFTVISQTTYLSSFIFTSSKERLFFFSYLLKRWQGWERM